MAIFVFIRVLFCYADNRQELCSRNFMIYEDYAEVYRHQSGGYSGVPRDRPGPIPGKYGIVFFGAAWTDLCELSYGMDGLHLAHHRIEVYVKAGQTLTKPAHWTINGIERT